MQLFMRNVPFGLSETHLQIAIASIVHQPPFPSDPKINFHVELFRQKRSKSHRGMGILTFPYPRIGELFLNIYVTKGLMIHGRPIMFTKSNKEQDEGLIQKLRTSEWEDPEMLRRQKQKQLEDSDPLPIASFSFGRFDRSGRYSAEVEVQGRLTEVICEMSLRQLHLRMLPRQSNDGDSRAWTLDSLFEMVFPQPVYLVRYLASSIVAVVESESSHPHTADGGTLTRRFQVFLESCVPPTFQYYTEVPLMGDSSKSQRLSSLRGTESIPPVISQLSCITFSSRDAQKQFLKRCWQLNLPHPVVRSIDVISQQVYAKTNLENLNTFLVTLDFRLAFEVEKSILSGYLEPNEVSRDLSDAINRLGTQHPEHAAAIFRSFTLALPIPGLESTIHLPVPNRRRRRRRNIQLPRPTLVQQLEEAVDEYFAARYRPKGRFSLVSKDSPGMYQSYHLIITPTSRILEGPLPDQSNSVLRRYGNHECFLRVSFQDEDRSKPRRDPSLLLDELLNSRFRQFLVNGVFVAGRHYEFLGYSMSGLKDYAFSFMRHFQYEGARMDANEIRDTLGDFSRVQYHPALLAARWSQAFSASYPSVILQKSEIRFIDDRQASDGSVFTDGVGTISPQLAKEVWSRLQRTRRKPSRLREAPSAFQFRLGGAKGVLVQDPLLEGKCVCLRPSQTKFEGGAVLSLDITTTSHRPLLMYLNRPLILLLEHYGTSSSKILDLQTQAVASAETMQESLSRASATMTLHSLGSSYRLPSLFNNLRNLLGLDIDANEPGIHGLQFIKKCIKYSLIHILRDIKHRAHIHVPDSYTLLGVADEWDCLDEGEIYATAYDERIGLEHSITGRVMITRSPQIHPGDVQFVTAVRRPQLEHLRNVVVFSCRGSRSLPSCLGGGDLDGDIYNLILNEDLFPPRGFTSEPGAYVQLERKRTEEPCTLSDVADFVVDYIKSDLVAYISILHLRIADLKDDGPACNECLLLAEKASHAVDFPKVGTPVDFSSLPQPPSNMKPDFLSGEVANPHTGSSYYPSVKLLGKLYRNVPIEQYYEGERPVESEGQTTDGAIITAALYDNLLLEDLRLPSLQYLEVDDDLWNEMSHMLEEYAEQLLVIAKAHINSKKPGAHLSEAELVSGTIQARWLDPRRRREAVAAMNTQTQELARAIRREFSVVVPQSSASNGVNSQSSETSDDEEDWVFDAYEYEYDEELESSVERRRETFKRAWAGWLVAQEALEDDEPPFGAHSFGLLALSTMLDMVKDVRT